MTTIKPYLIQALRNWAHENNLTPQILVDADFQGVDVPVAYVKDGHIVLNIHDMAVDEFTISDDWLLFSGRFSEKIYPIEVPVEAVVAIFARENGEGLILRGKNTLTYQSEEEQDTSESPRNKAKGKPNLRLVQ